jgi:hypothetical protein
MRDNPGAASQFPSIGRWSVTAMPSGWIYVAEFGIRQMRTNVGSVAASVGVGQDTLPSESGLADYIEAQKKLMDGHLKEARFAGPQATAFPGADEASLLFVRHSVQPAGILLHAQTYARSGRWVGIITLTALETQLQAVRTDYEAFVKGLRIGPARSNAPQAKTEPMTQSG